MKIKKFIAQSPIVALYRGNTLLIEPFQIRLAKEGVHLLQGLILTALFFEDQEVRPFELANILQVSKSNLSHSLRSLEKKGWIERGIHSQDARGYLFSLTSTGKKKAVVLIRIFDEAEEVIERNIGRKETKDFVNIVNMFITNSRNTFPNFGTNKGKPSC
jgi:DNA-binding MarR family transcriptional regulator